MADPVTLTVIAMAAGTAMSAGASVMKGRAEYAASKFEEQQLKIQEENQRIAAAQTEARRTEELTSSLETIQAIRSGRGVGQGSPTGSAILTSVTEDALRDIQTEKLGILQKADQSRLAARLADRKASTSLLAGYLNAGATVAKSGFDYATLGTPRARY
jgi:hypothetical protein